MKKITLFLLLTVFTNITWADESPILYRCQAKIEPAKTPEFNNGDGKFYQLSLKAKGSLSRSLRSAVIDSFRKVSSKYNFFCDPNRYLPNDVLMESNWENIDRDEKFIIAHCWYKCEEDSL